MLGTGVEIHGDGNISNFSTKKKKAGGRITKPISEIQRNPHSHARLNIHNNIIHNNTNLTWQDEHICSLPTKVQKN